MKKITLYTGKIKPMISGKFTELEPRKDYTFQNLDELIDKIQDDYNISTDDIIDAFENIGEVIWCGEIAIAFDDYEEVNRN